MLSNVKTTPAYLKILENKPDIPVITSLIITSKIKKGEHFYCSFTFSYH